MVEGDGAYSRFKFESGVHRVQRVPITESQGRIQTSTVTVAVGKGIVGRRSKRLKPIVKIAFVNFFIIFLL